MKNAVLLGIAVVVSISATASRAQPATSAKPANAATPAAPPATAKAVAEGAGGAGANAGKKGAGDRIDLGRLRIQERIVAEDDYPTYGVRIGQGWDSYLGQRTQAVCIDGKDASLENFEARTSYSDILDREHLFRELNVSVHASYGPVSGRASFLQQATIDKMARTILAKVFVNKGGLFAVPADGQTQLGLSAYAKRILTDANVVSAEQRLANFKRICGDSFVTAIHSGGRYDALFNLQQDKQSLLTQFKASAKGSYGAGSAGGSVSALTIKNTDKEKLSVETSQFGGEPGIVPGGVRVQGGIPKDKDGNPIVQVGGNYYTADNVIEKVALFESMGDGFAKPYAISLEQYKVLWNWPSELIDKQLVPWNMLSLQGSIWRYRELADTYAVAAGSDTQFYFPFSRPDADDAKPEAMTRADIQSRVATQASFLYATANCFEGWAAVCAGRSSCEFEDIFTGDSVEKVCPSMLQGDEKSLFVYQALNGYGRQPERTLARLLKAAAASTSAGAQAAQLTKDKVSDLVKQSRRMPLVSTKISGLESTALASFDATATADLAGTDKRVRYLSPGHIYYALLAEAPMARGPVRNEIPDANDGLDESNHVMWMCQAASGEDSCKAYAFQDIAASANFTTSIATKQPTGADNDPKPDKAAGLYRRWVFQSRLLPLVRTYCKVAGHPLCLPPDQALYISNKLTVTFGAPRMFVKNPPAPAAAPVKVEYERSPCSRPGGKDCGFVR